VKAPSIVVVVAVAIAVAGAPACERASNETVTIAVSPAEMSRLETRVEQVMNRPEVEQAMDALFDAVAADPALGALAGQLADQLMADPKIAAATEGLIAEMGESPALMTWTLRYMETHPGLDPEGVGEAVGVEVEQRFESLLTRPVEREIGQLVERAQGGAGLASLEKHLSSQFDRVLDAYFEQPARKGRWSKRLIELNGGKKPAPNLAAQLYIDHAWSEERMLRFMVRACADPEVRRALVTLLRRVLEDRSLRTHLQRAARTLAADADLRHATVRVFEVLFISDASPDAIDARVKALFDSPAVLAAVNDLAQNLLAEPALHQILDDTIAGAAKQPTVRAALDELCDGW